ncbi:MAG: YybH family protein [Bryobacteraceae bacterium]
MNKFVGCALLCWMGLGLALFTSGCSQQTADTRAADESAVRETDAQWAKTALANDLDGAVSYYTDDASMLPPNAPIATGKQAIRAVWATMLSPDAAVSRQVTKADVARSGELAYVMGVYQITAKNPQGKALEDRGKLVEVWKKQADGKWKTVADIFNSDVPLPAPAAIRTGSAATQK